MDQFINQPVVNWARQNLPQSIEVKLKAESLGFKILLGICLAFLALIFLGIPLLLYISAISTFLSEGWNSKVSGGLGSGTFFLVVFGALASGFFLLIRFIRRNIAKVFNHEGVETRNGKKFSWENLYFLNYKKVSGKAYNRNLAAVAVNSALFAGIEKVNIEMIFANGKAVVPPVIQNQAEILAMLNSIPVQRRDEGKIRQ